LSRGFFHRYANALGMLSTSRQLTVYVDNPGDSSPNRRRRSDTTCLVSSSVISLICACRVGSTPTPDVVCSRRSKCSCFEMRVSSSLFRLLSCDIIHLHTRFPLATDTLLLRHLSAPVAGTLYCGSAQRRKCRLDSELRERSVLNGGDLVQLETVLRVQQSA
jgi:hypothetical protein